MQNKILYISYDGMTDHLGQSQVLPYLVGLTKRGYDFTLISCEKSENYKKYGAIIKEICEKSAINWNPIFYTKRPPVFSTVKDILNLRRTALKLSKSQRFEATHCRSYVPALVGLELKKKFKIPFVFDMRGFWPEEKSEVDTWPLKNPIYRSVYNYFKKKEKEFFQQADGVISLTEAGKVEINSWGIRSKDSNEIKVIPCSVDFDHFKPLESKKKYESRAALGIPEEANLVTFIGGIGSWYMLDEMLDFFKVYQEKKENAKLFFITSDNAVFLKNEAQKKGIDPADLYVQHATREQVPLMLSASDVGLFFIKPYYSKKGSSPTKLGEYLALNIPVFTNVGIGDVDDIITNTKGGALVKDFTTEAYIQSIDDMDKIPPLSERNIREMALPYYDLERAVESYYDVYQKAIQTKQKLNA